MFKVLTYVKQMARPTADLRNPSTYPGDVSLMHLFHLDEEYSRLDPLRFLGRHQNGLSCWIVLLSQEAVYRVEGPPGIVEVGRFQEQEHMIYIERHKGFNV